MHSDYYYHENNGHTVEMRDGTLYRFSLTDRLWGYGLVWRMEMQITRIEADASAKEPFYVQCSN